MPFINRIMSLSLLLLHGGGGLFLVHPTSHKVLDLLLGYLAYRRLVGELRPGNLSLQLGSGVYDPVLEDEPLAL